MGGDFTTTVKRSRKRSRGHCRMDGRWQARETPSRPRPSSVRAGSRFRDCRVRKRPTFFMAPTAEGRMLVASTSVLASTALLLPLALRERRHRGLACCGIAVRRRAIFVILKGQRPHPRRIPATRGRAAYKEKPRWRGAQNFGINDATLAACPVSAALL